MVPTIIEDDQEARFAATEGHPAPSKMPDYLAPCPGGVQSLPRLQDKHDSGHENGPDKLRDVHQAAHPPLRIRGSEPDSLSIGRGGDGGNHPSLSERRSPIS
ncbi:UNVERIFIED_CONTAM: hypothetical protein FKN15_056028 [Acipenser sinensis]